MVYRKHPYVHTKLRYRIVTLLAGGGLGVFMVSIYVGAISPYS